MKRRVYLKKTIYAFGGLNLFPVLTFPKERGAISQLKNSNKLSSSLWANLALEHYRKQNSEEYILYLYYIKERYRNIGSRNDLPSTFAVFESAKGLRNSYNTTKNAELLFSDLNYENDFFLDLISQIPWLGQAVDAYKHLDYLSQRMALMDYFSIQSRYDYPINRFKNIFESQNAAYFRQNSFDLLLEIDEISAIDPEFKSRLIDFNLLVGFESAPGLSVNQYIREEPNLDYGGFLSRTLLTLDYHEESDNEFGIRSEDVNLLKQSLFNSFDNFTSQVDNIPGENNSEEEWQLSRLRLQADLDKYQTALNASVSILSLLDKKHAAQLQIIGSSGIEMFRILKNTNNWSSTFVAFGVFGAGIGAVNALSALSAPSENEMIMDFLNKFSKEVFARLEIIDDKLNYIIEGLDKMYSDIVTEIRDLGFQVERISEQVNVFEQNVRSYFEDLNKEERFKLELNCLKPDSVILNRKLSKDEFEECLKSVIQIAAIETSSALSTGGSERDFSNEGFFLEIAKYPISYNLSFINACLYQRFNLEFNQKIVPNPVEWVYASKAFLHILGSNNEHIKKVNPKSFTNIIQPGIETSKFIGSIKENEIRSMLNQFPVLKGSAWETMIQEIEVKEMKKFPVGEEVSEPIFKFADSFDKRLTEPPGAMTVGIKYKFPLGINSESSIIIDYVDVLDYAYLPYIMRNNVLIHQRIPDATYRGVSGLGLGGRLRCLNFELTATPENEIIKFVPINLGIAHWKDEIVAKEFIEYMDETILEKARFFISKVKLAILSDSDFELLLVENRIKFRLFRETIMLAFGDIIFKNNSLYEKLMVRSPLDEGLKVYEASEGNILDKMLTANDDFIEDIKIEILEALSSTDKLNPKNLGSPLVEETLRQLNHAKALIEKGQPVPEEYLLKIDG